MKEKILENLKTIIVITVILVIIGIILLIGMNQKQIDLEPLEFEQELEEPKEPETSKIKIDIKGEIKHPGVYQLEEGDRVSDAIKISGGLTENADTELINLSKTKTRTKRTKNDNRIYRKRLFMPRHNKRCMYKRK